MQITHDEYEPKSLFDLQRTCSVWHWQLGVAEEGDQGAYSVVSIKRTGGNKGTGYTVNISAVKITVFRCVQFPAVLSLYFLHCTTAPITVEKCKH